MLLVTPLKTAIVECTEMSQSFTEQELPESKVREKEHYLHMFLSIDCDCVEQFVPSFQYIVKIRLHHIYTNVIQFIY